MRENNQENKKYKIAVIVIFIIVCCYMVVDTVRRIREGDEKNLKIDFAGRVDQISYDIEQYPTIVVGESTYYIGAGYATDHQIDVGDSLIKLKGSDTYKLIKYKTHKIILFRK